MIEFLNRLGRPLLRLFCVTWVAVVGSAVAYEYWSAVLSDRPVNDMSGGITNILLGLVPLAIDQFTRSGERREEIRVGQRAPPFPSSAPSPPPSPPDDTEGPRPWQNRE